jgi:hypothetical protein
VQDLFLERGQMKFYDSFDDPETLLPFLGFRFRIAHRIVSVFVQFYCLQVTSAAQDINAQILDRYHRQRFRLFTRTDPVCLFPQAEESFLQGIVSVFLAGKKAHGKPEKTLPQFGESGCQCFFAHVLLWPFLFVFIKLNVKLRFL